MRVDYNPYEGTQVEGAPARRHRNGEVIIEGDKFVGKKGAGRFIKRGPSQAPGGAVTRDRDGTSGSSTTATSSTRSSSPTAASSSRDRSAHRGEPALQRRPRAGADRAAQLDDLQLRGAVDQHGALHPDLHAGVGADRGGHELVAGAPHDRCSATRSSSSRSCSTRIRARSTAFRSRSSRARRTARSGRTCRR